MKWFRQALIFTQEVVKILEQFFFNDTSFIFENSISIQLETFDQTRLFLFVKHHTLALRGFCLSLDTFS